MRCETCRGPVSRITDERLSELEQNPAQVSVNDAEAMIGEIARLRGLIRQLLDVDQSARLELVFEFFAAREQGLARHTRQLTEGCQEARRLAVALADWLCSIPGDWLPARAHWGVPDDWDDQVERFREQLK